MRAAKRMAKEADAALVGAPAAGRWARRAPARATSGRARARARTMTWHRVLRLAVQAAFFVLAPGVFASAMNGVRAIFADLGATEPVELASFVVILAAALAYTVLFGRFFCGYACAFGTMGDVLYCLGTPLRRLLRLEGKPIRGRLASTLRWVKFALLAAICALCFTGLWGAVSAHDPWTVFGRAAAGEFSEFDAVGLGLLVAIMVFQMLFERSFCRFLCPMGAVFSLMPVLPFSQYGRDAGRCGKRWCSRCIDNCPAGIYPDRGSVTAGECFECGRCADVCPLGNANLLVRMEKATAEGEPGQAAPVPGASAAMGAPSSAATTAAAVPGPPSATAEGGTSTASQGARKKKRPQVLWSFKGTGAVYVLVRAVLLLGLLWLVGATRFLPEAASVLPGLPWPG